MKGFKKDGKFRPTEKRNKSSLSKKDITNQSIAKLNIIHEQRMPDAHKTLGEAIDEGNESRNRTKSSLKKSLDSSDKFTMEDYNENLSTWESTNGGEIRNALALAKKYGTKSEIADMESMLYSYEGTGNTHNFEYDEMTKIDSKYYHQFKADQEIYYKKSLDKSHEKTKYGQLTRVQKDLVEKYVQKHPEVVSFEDFLWDDFQEIENNHPSEFIHSAVDQYIEDLEGYTD